MEATPRALGLRIQIVMALAGLLLLAFLPLFFAIASLTRATLRTTRDDAALAVGRAVASHVAQARTQGISALGTALASQASGRRIESVCVYGPERTAEACAGDHAQLPFTAPAEFRAELVLEGTGPSGRIVDVVVGRGDALVVTRFRADDAAARAAPLLRLVALYVGSFALALLTFTYFVLTRLLVRPIDALAQAADRVARGAHTLTLPRTGARELTTLATSMQTMTTRLIAEEAALRAKVEELTRAKGSLTEAKNQLVRSERLASVGRLAAGVAHEIGNPIAALIGMEDLLLDGDMPEDDQRDFLRRMRKETERINGVVRDLLDFARPTQGSLMPPGMTEPPARVRDVVEDVVALLRPQKTFKGVDIRVDVADASLSVVLGAHRLTQVLLNLGLNAGDAMASKDAREEGARFAIRAHRDGADVVVVVEDTGPGVEEAVRETIFQPFVTTKQVGEGTGLGLAVCAGLVEAAGGEIALDASYDRGARFVVRLPSAPSE